MIYCLIPSNTNTFHLIFIFIAVVYPSVCHVVVWTGIVTVFKKEFEKGINKVTVKKILTKFYSSWSSYMNVTIQLKLTFCINKLLQPTQGSYIFLS